MNVTPDLISLRSIVGSEGHTFIACFDRFTSSCAQFERSCAATAVVMETDVILVSKARATVQRGHEAGEVKACAKADQNSFLVMFLATRHSGHATLWSTSFVSQSPGTIADQWECKDLDRTTKTSDIGRKEFWYQPRTHLDAHKEYLQLTG